MIVSKVDMESEHEGTQIIMVKGSEAQIATELENVMKEMVKRGFPEELLIKSVIEVVEYNHKK